MSKYSGLFLSFLLIFICLWINICHYPQVWKMVNGTDYPSSGEGADSAADENILETNAAPAESEPLYARADRSDENWPKPVIITASFPPAASEENDAVCDSADNADGDPDDEVFRRVSFTADQCSAEAVSEAARAEEPAAAPSDVISDISEGGIRVHSSYLAAEFSEESSPLDHETPSYQIDPSKTAE